MGNAEQQHKVDEAFEKIEGSILPNMSLMLDMLLDAATLSRPGKDSEDYAAELRALALQLETLTREVEAISPVRIENRDYCLFSLA